MRIINSRVFIFSLFFLSLSAGCCGDQAAKPPQDYIRQSEAYYQKAVNQYKELIARSKDSGKLYFALGKIYYDRGELDKAVEAFKKSPEPEAQKFIAIADYRLGNFTDALETFNRRKFSDDEYAYYHGLTCERLNLFDQALGIYKGINSPEFKPKAKERLEIIEKIAGVAYIREIDPGIHKVITNSPAQEDFPQAGALILLANEKIEVSAENTQVSTGHYLIKILNERGKDSFAEAPVEYDSTFEKVELVYARTIKPDGTVADVGSRHIRDVTKYLNFPLYSNARVFIISFPEVAIGSCLEYKIKIKRSELINKKDLVLDYPIQAAEPILSASLSLILPKEKQPQIKILNAEYNDFSARLAPEIEPSGKNIIYRWQFKNIPQIIAEANMPPEVEINPVIMLSTFKDWGEIYRWWQALAENKAQPDRAIKEKVKSLIKGKESGAQKAQAIHNFCAKEIRYVAVEYGQAGYEPHYAADVFKNKYGDCKDQAILLVTMLKEAGLKAYPVLIGAKGYYDLNLNFPSTLFNHCIAAVELESGIIFLDPTAETCSFGDLPLVDQARKVLIFKPDNYLIQDTPLYPAGHNLARQDSKIRVNDDESIFVSKKNFTYGLYDQSQRYWLLYTQPSQIQDTLRAMAQDFSIGAKLNKYKIDNLNDLNQPVVLTYSFYGPEYFTVAGAWRIMPQLARVDASLVSKPKRKYPLDLETLDSRDNFLEIEIPQGLAIKNMPDSLNKESPWFDFKVEYGFKDGKITFRQLLETKKNKVSQQEYKEFKYFLEGLARSTKQRIVLERTK